MPFILGKRSLTELVGVHDDLIGVVKRAIQLTKQDFSVHDGVRSAEEQLELYNRGASKLDGYTKKSRHQTGHAVDLVPYVNGKLRWEWELIFPVADAVKQAADECSVMIRWGGTWQLLNGTKNKGKTAKQLYEDNPAWDGVHFELPSTLYPS